MPVDAQEESETYYHHTDKASLKKILETGKILKSEKKIGDAAGGDGTYLTKMGPSYSRTKIAKNNYDGLTARFYEDKVDSGKTDVAIEFQMARGTVHDHSKDLKRDVHRYPDNVDLKNVTGLKVHVRNGEGIHTFEPQKK
ncbi:uncharacterized protein LOC143074498 [Mytilus galloprovincialis]|uniref:uncharacterized protein LOC143074498 n=1 Tax=Mytilus galloprovincialis TaxID=29158 RepID=UPI003F7BEBDF